MKATVQQVEMKQQHKRGKRREGEEWHPDFRLQMPPPAALPLPSSSSSVSQHRDEDGGRASARASDHTATGTRAGAGATHDEEVNALTRALHVTDAAL
mgnify:FL=1